MICYSFVSSGGILSTCTPLSRMVIHRCNALISPVGGRLKSPFCALVVRWRFRKKYIVNILLTHCIYISLFFNLFLLNVHSCVLASCVHLYPALYQYKCVYCIRTYIGLLRGTQFNLFYHSLHLYKCLKKKTCIPKGVGCCFFDWYLWAYLWLVLSH